MATDATGTPSTNYAIPKFNTAVDAPTGKGSNAIVDAIDSIIPFNKSMVTTKGDLIVVTGSGTYTRLGVGTDGQALIADSASSGGVKWAAPAGVISIVTSLPGLPADGDKVIFTDSTSAPTYQWLLQYVSAKASNKWIFLGGDPIISEVATEETITSGSTTYVALTTAGPSIAVPVAGDYIVTIGCSTRTGAGTSRAVMSYDIGGTGAVDADGVGAFSGGSNGPGWCRYKKKAGLTAVTLTMKYKQVPGGGSESVVYGNRFMHLTPIAIGG